jgi:hypothetical protein
MFMNIFPYQLMPKLSDIQPLGALVNLLALYHVLRHSGYLIFR